MKIKIFIFKIYQWIGLLIKIVKIRQKFKVIKNLA
jgi:hypothetical protein